MSEKYHNFIGPDIDKNDVKPCKSIIYTHTNKDSRGIEICAEVLKIIVSDGENYISFDVHNIDTFIERLKGFKSRWNLN